MVPSRQGTRWAWAGLIVAGVTMLLGAVYFTGLLFLGGATVTLVDWLAVSLFPMAFAVCLLLGAGPTFRHARTTASLTSRGSGFLSLWSVVVHVDGRVAEAAGNQPAVHG